MAKPILYGLCVWSYVFIKGQIYILRYPFVIWLIKSVVLYILFYFCLVVCGDIKYNQVSIGKPFIFISNDNTKSLT